MFGNAVASLRRVRVSKLNVLFLQRPHHLLLLLTRYGKNAFSFDVLKEVMYLDVYYAIRCVLLWLDILFHRNKLFPNAVLFFAMCRCISHCQYILFFFLCNCFQIMLMHFATINETMTWAIILPRFVMQSMIYLFFFF